MKIIRHWSEHHISSVKNTTRTYLYKSLSRKSYTVHIHLDATMFLFSSSQVSTISYSYIKKVNAGGVCDEDSVWLFSVFPRVKLAVLRLWQFYLSLWTLYIHLAISQITFALTTYLHRKFIFISYRKKRKRVCFVAENKYKRYALLNADRSDRRGS